MKSASEMLLNKTYREIWRRGEKYADKGLVAILQSDNDAVHAEVKGTQRYEITIKVAPSRVNRKCDCPYYAKNGHICKHIVAVAIYWDEERGIARPTSEAVERGSVPPPNLTTKDINSIFNVPLEAELAQLRILPEETALGGYGRPHARLPEKPKMEQDITQSLSPVEINRCFSEIKRWSHRKLFDPYFCAGEMVAAYCEILRTIKTRLTVTPLAVGADILLSAQKFNRLLVTELIDDSQGLHEISEAHLESIYEHLQESSAGLIGETDCGNLLDKYIRQRGQY